MSKKLEGCEGFIPSMLVGKRVMCCGKPAVVIFVQPTRGPGIPGWEAFLQFSYFIDSRPRRVKPHKDRTDIELYQPEGWYHFSSLTPLF